MLLAVQWQCLLQQEPLVWPPPNSPHRPTAVSHPLVQLHIPHCNSLAVKSGVTREAHAKTCSDATLLCLLYNNEPGDFHMLHVIRTHTDSNNVVD